MLNKGDVIIFPTDTVYGIGASAFDKKGQDLIYEIKERPLSKRLSILCASLADIEKIAYVSSDAKKLIEAFMPGGLTLILKTREEAISDSIHENVGVRIPNHPLALAILRENGPMATSSVNKSGMPPLNDYDDIVFHFAAQVKKIYPNNETPSRLASTVINLTKSPYEIIREGSITLDDIEKVLNK